MGTHGRAYNLVVFTVLVLVIVGLALYLTGSFTSIAHLYDGAHNGNYGG